MSDNAPLRRIRAQTSALDAGVMGFVLDSPVQGGATVRFAGAREAADSPLGRALFAVAGVARVEVAGAGGETIWVRKDATADWARLKPAIAAQIRAVLGETDRPLGETGAGAGDPDAELFAAVEQLLAERVNPSIAGHGGHIAVERVAGGVVWLSMSGGCQGCAASAVTLRQGVERSLRAARPDIVDIVDATDHAGGKDPFYRRDAGPSPLLARLLPEGTVALRDGRIEVDPQYLAPRLGLSPEALQEGLRSGAVTGVAEAGEGEHAGLTRVTLHSARRAWAAEIAPDGSAREVPPPAPAAAAARAQGDLAARLRRHLEARPADAPPLSYGALARAMGMYAPGSVRKLTRALETLMREDAAAGRPFVAARAVSRARLGLPGKGFFDLARQLGRGPGAGQSERAFHAGELARLAQAVQKEDSH